MKSGMHGRRRRAPRAGRAPAVGGGNGGVRRGRRVLRRTGSWLRSSPAVDSRAGCGRTPARHVAGPGRCRSETRGTGTGADLSSRRTDRVAGQPCRAAVAASLEGPRAALGAQSAGGRGGYRWSSDVWGDGGSTVGGDSQERLQGRSGGAETTGLRPPEGATAGAGRRSGGRGPLSAGWLPAGRRRSRITPAPGGGGGPGATRRAASLRGPRCGGRPRCRHLPGERGDHRDAGAGSRPGDPGRG